MLGTIFRKDGETNFCWNFETPIVMLPRKPQTKSWPLEMWLLFIMKISQEESGGKIESLVTGSDG